MEDKFYWFVIFGLIGAGLFVLLLLIVFDFILWLVVTLFVIVAAVVILPRRDVDWRRTWKYRVRLFVYRHL